MTRIVTTPFCNIPPLPSQVHSGLVDLVLVVLFLLLLVVWNYQSLPLRLDLPSESPCYSYYYVQLGIVVRRVCMSVCLSGCRQNLFRTIPDKDTKEGVSRKGDRVIPYMPKALVCHGNTVSIHNDGFHPLGMVVAATVAAGNHDHSAAMSLLVVATPYYYGPLAYRRLDGSFLVPF